MKSWIHLSKGVVAKQAHVNVHKLDGLKEDQISRHGFAGRSALLYRRNEPTAWSRLEGEMRPWDLDGYKLEPSDHGDARGGPLRLFHNDDVSISISRRKEATPFLLRNADGDEVYFVHEGSGLFDTEFGPIPYEPGDYVVLPKSVTYRIVPDSTTNYFLIVESVGEIGFADIGPIGRHAPFDPTLLYIPAPAEDAVTRPSGPNGEWEVRVKHNQEYTSVFYPFDPLDVVGWKGDLFPFKVNIRDFRPIMSDRIHLMPSAHAIFAAKGFMICNFLTRPAERDPEAERAPPFHRNADYDEMMFVHGGSLLNSAVAPATIRTIPQGLHHGIPEAVRREMRENWNEIEMYDQQMIGIDTERALQVSSDVRLAARTADQISKSRTD